MKQLVLNGPQKGGFEDSAQRGMDDSAKLRVKSTTRTKTIRKSVVFTAQEDDYIRDWADVIGVSDQDVIRRSVALARFLREQLPGHDLVLQPRLPGGVVKQIVVPSDLLGS
jgi:hypothetical protein